jgi:hypothetical protein
VDRGFHSLASAPGGRPPSDVLQPIVGLQLVNQLEQLVWVDWLNEMHVATRCL